MKLCYPLFRSVARKAALTILLFGAALSPQRASATLTVDAARVVRAQKPNGIGGAGINAHDNKFATNRYGIPFQTDLNLAGMRLVRTVTFPDFKATSHNLSYFDANLSAILAQGAQPLFVMYLKPGIAYLKADGTPGGTMETNIVYLVNHYKAAPYNLTLQYWELGNEPDCSVDYQMTPEEYATYFNSIHNALVAAGIRSNVKLCGPASMNDYGWGQTSYPLMNYFMQNCKDAVDVITRHIYICDPDENNQLNGIDRIERQWNAALAPVAHGESYLQAAMNSYGVPSTVMTGITEFNVATSGSNPYLHSMTQGLWNALALTYATYNPRSALTTGFIFDSYGALDGGLGYYDNSENRDPTWWAHYICGNFVKPTVMQQLSTNSKLVVCATRDASNIYVEVINRDIANAYTDYLTVNNAYLGAATVFSFSSSTNTLLTGSDCSFGAPFPYTFPSKSITVFRMPFSGIFDSGFNIGFEPNEGYASGSPVTANSKWLGSSTLFTVTSGSGGQYLQSAPTTGSVGAYLNVSATPVANDFDGSSAPITAGYAGLVGGSFDVTVNQNATTPNTTKSWFFRMGGKNECEFFLRADNTLEISTSAGNFLASKADGSAFVAGNQPTRVTYLMNYATQTSLIAVNGIEQHTTGGAYNIPWVATGTNPNYSVVSFQNNVATTSAQYSRISIDNVSYGLPESAVIDFEASSGYALGALQNSQWGGVTSLFTVAAHGKQSAQCLYATGSNVSIGAYSNITHGVSASDFGGNSAPVTAGYTGRVAGSFNLSVATPAATQNTTATWFIRFGGTGYFEMFVQADGCLQIRSTAGNFLAKNSDGSNLVIGADFATVDYIMDFASQTVKVWVNGAAQKTTAGNVNIPWQGAPTNARFSVICLQNNVATTDARYSRIRLDNIDYCVP